MEIEELKVYSEAAQQAVDRLMGELANGSRCTEETLRAVVEDRNAHLYIVREGGQIVASACLCVAHTTEQQIGFVEAVVVSEVCRGKGYGRMLMEHLIAEAKRLK